MRKLINTTANLSTNQSTALQSGRRPTLRMHRLKHRNSSRTIVQSYDGVTKRIRSPRLWAANEKQATSIWLRKVSRRKYDAVKVNESKEDAKKFIQSTSSHCFWRVRVSSSKGGGLWSWLEQGPVVRVWLKGQHAQRKFLYFVSTSCQSLDIGKFRFSRSNCYNKNHLNDKCDWKIFL